MAAATGKRDAQRQDGVLKAHLVDGGSVIYRDTLVCHNATGYLAPGADTANFKFAGVACETADNSAGADGAVKCKVHKTGEFEFAYGGGDATQALLGQEVYLVDNQTVDEDGAVTANDIKCGTVAEVVSAGKVRVRIDHYAR